jgi:hypothetical protein
VGSGQAVEQLGYACDVPLGADVGLGEGVVGLREPADHGLRSNLRLSEPGDLLPQIPLAVRQSSLAVRQSSLAIREPGYLRRESFDGRSLPCLPVDERRDGWVM